MMSNLDKKAVKTLSQLSRIDCSEEEQEALLQDLKKILQYVEQLNEVDTTHVAPCNQVLEDMANVMREDIPGISMPRKTFLALVPAEIGGLVRVPTIKAS